MSKKSLIIGMIFLIVIFLTGCNDDENDVNDIDYTDKLIIYNFYGDTCPICAQQKVYLEKWAEDENVTLKTIEVYNSAANQKIMLEVGEFFGFDPSGVPITVIGDQYWIGFSNALENQMQAKINQCLENVCEDSIFEIVFKDN